MVFPKNFIKEGQAQPRVYFEASVNVIVLVMLGRFMENSAKSKAKNSLQALMQLNPKYALLVKNEQQLKVEIDQINIGDIVFVKPGEQVPIDGVVVEGSSKIDCSMVTGESFPVSVKVKS